MKRLEGETFEEYKLRRADQNKTDKRKLKGKLFWLSTVRGKYVKSANHGWKGEENVQED